MTTRSSVTRRQFFGWLATAGAYFNSASAQSTQSRYHGFKITNFEVNGCKACLVKPNHALHGKPWIWRTMFWDAFPTADLALLAAGFHLAFIDVGDTFGCPDAMKHFDVFYRTMTEEHGLAQKVALEGLSRGGLYAYRWGSENAEKVGALYGDAPVCDMKSWPGGKGKSPGDQAEWAKAIAAYHFSSDQEMLDFKGNPVDTLAPLAAAKVPVLHVCGDADSTVPVAENTDIVRQRYMALGGSFALILKHGCEHHPHGLRDPAPIVDFITVYCASGKAAHKAAARAPQPGSVLVLEPAQWQPTNS
jgi:pimeloyl-ACP methyl ester carboxylesterase